MAEIRPTTTPLGNPLTALGFMPAPGFTSIAIPLPHGSLYLNPIFTSEPSSIARSSSTPARRTLVRGLPASPTKPKSNDAYTLLIVNDNPVDRKILGKICERWGQPYEVAEDGLQAVAMYEREPERFRCILMDLIMPVMDGFNATQKIRALEEDSWNAVYDSTATHFRNASSNRSRSLPNPIRRAVIIALVPSYSVTGVRQRIADTGFDLSICRPFHQGTLCNMLFSGPGMNVVGLYGGVDDSVLQNAGYPLQILRRKPNSIGEKEVGEVLGRAIV